MAVASRWPQRLPFAASISLSISRSVRYSRGRPDLTVTFTALEAHRSTCVFSMTSAPFCQTTVTILDRSVTVSRMGYRPPCLLSGKSDIEPTPPNYPVNVYVNDDLEIRIGMDVFILGYPFGAKPPGLPVWKRGSIASEPDLVRQTTGFYLIDTASRPGMSGSPVILRSWTSPDGRAREPLNRLIGVYSGRLGADVAEAQIGMVWHESFIPEIIDDNLRE